MLPWFFVALSAFGLIVFAVSFWRSLRAAFGVGELYDLETAVISESRRQLLAHKATLLQEIRELEFERDAGKISDKDFEQLNAELRRRATRVLRKLDEGVDAFRKEAEATLKEHLDTVRTQSSRSES